jgi:hypothetical protein
MARVTDEQIQNARDVTLLSYFQSTNPAILLEQKGERFVHKNHDSFVIDNGKGEWYWNSQGVKGHSALDYLMRVEKMDFLDAVKSLNEDNFVSSSDFSHRSSEPKKADIPPKSITLPKPAQNNKNMIAYLAKRDISESTSQKYINQGLLYESVNNNCVFVGRDAKDGNKPKYAAERGITGDNKKDTAGSDKSYSFYLPPDTMNGSHSVAVFESPIDALSHHEIMVIAEAERGTVWDGFRLSLSGTASVALIGFLERHPHVQNIYLSLDNDPAGQAATERITKELLTDKRFAGKSITIAPPPIGKDFNDTLINMRRLLLERTEKSDEHEIRKLDARPKRRVFLFNAKEVKP